MNVGELFLNLGVKGDKKTLGALDSMRKGLKDTASMSLEAKAGIVGAMYALEKLFATSGAAGTGLTNFNALLDVSSTTLQQYQYAARQAGVSNQETEGSFKALQATMTKTLMGEGAPKGLARVSMLTGGLTAEDLQTFAKKPQLLIQKLQEYAQKETNAGLRREVLSSFGVSEGMQAALTRGAFNPETLKKAPTYSEKEVGQLDRANVAWSNLGTKIEMAFGHFNALHGGQLVGDISGIVDQVLRLSDALQKFSTKSHAFELIGKAFQGWTLILQTFTDNIDELDNIFKGWQIIFDGLTAAFSAISEATQSPEDAGGAALNMGLAAADEIVDAGKNVFTSLLNSLKSEAPEPVKKPLTAREKRAQRPLSKGAAPALPGAQQIAAPPVTGLGASPAPMQNVEVNQTLNFTHDGKDAKKTGDSTKKAVQDAFRQMSAQAQGS